MFKFSLTLLRKLHFILYLFDNNIIEDGMRFLFVGFRVGHFAVFELGLARFHTWGWLFNKELWDSWDWDEEEADD